ncbi:uncharacterized protein [Rutidosis leptorrhynchoides]|uniref:uncharacterized protein n=1 Tax=Rutidosis leptorrhynchoides TaxID=125765 RepID=UPI003A99E1BE
MSLSSSSDDFTNYTLDILNGVNSSSNDGENTHCYIRRDHYGTHDRLIDDYFDEGCKYTDENFKLRWFPMRLYSRGKWSISTHLKVNVALRQLTYGYASDALDEYLQMSERVSWESLPNFRKCVIVLYANEYLREPTRHDNERLYAVARLV